MIKGTVQDWDFVCQHFFLSKSKNLSVNIQSKVRTKFAKTFILENFNSNKTVKVLIIRFVIYFL